MIEDPDALLALGYARWNVRDPLRVLLALDERMAGVAGLARDPLFAQMRFAWWREAIGKRTNVADPLLIALRAVPEIEELALSLVDGWDALGEGDHDAFAQGRGGALFEHFSGDLAWREIGEGWALARVDIGAALEKLRPLRALKANRDVRPLAILAWLALRDLETPPERRLVPGSPQRMLRALRYALAGAH